MRETPLFIGLWGRFDTGLSIAYVIDEANDRSLLLFQLNQQPKLLQGSDRLSVLTWIPLELTANQVFGWLKMAAE
jgi:hypothetical protein